MSRLADIEAFVAVIERGSLTDAAHHLGRSLQAVSRSLASLESDVGVQLVHRTTRQCSASEAGQDFYRRVKPAVAEIREAELEASNRRSEPSGVLRIGAPVQFGPKFLVPVIAEYMRAYPGVEVDLQLSDALTDFSAEGLDLVVRISELPDSGLQGKRLGTLRRVVFAAPSYFEKHGRPAHPSDLRQHSCIVRAVEPRSGQWSFLIDGKPRMVTVNGPFRANTTAAVYSAIIHGLGIGYSPLWQVRHLLDAGKVELVLEEFEPKPVPVHVLWQENRFPPAKVRAFVDLLSARLKLTGL
ncbi:LysR family transcriptional regulator [Rhizobium sp. LC145]|uniref:LysR family transcriptional regulator n=1 Tax=Rhizobium sp. LC145 TaxID=1120688 RepID=UPI00062A261E|nr:LysR family transcriptional regulator [Rhizobium sp. LC145]KKX30521.1 transcriptional regulator [Rhizobium sp. LC145]TKT46511.1 LysR family transcriptional regulator [Rhizobiaceae bacterium LC148]